MIYSFLLSLVLYYIYIYLKTTKSLHMLQQNRYNRGKKYWLWLKQNLTKNFINISLLTFITIFFCFIDSYFSMVYIFNVIFFVLALILVNKKDQEKLPLVYTSRIKRLIVTNLLVHTLIVLGIYLVFQEQYLAYYYVILSIVAYLNPLIVILDNFINRPIEKMVSNHFRNMAVKRLQSMNNMEVIGITGSYGKTSSKNILNDILNIKYNAFPTPKNFNTPFGLMITINEHLDKFTDYFIAEMGACRKGEIKELCDLVHPKYGIITTIGLAHLETFGSEENIQKTKFELIESLPSDGLGVLNADDPKQLNYQIKNNVPITWIGIDNQDADIVASDIKLSANGTEFKIKLKNKKQKYQFSTKLLGKANVYNILAGIALGLHLNIPMDKLIIAVKKVKPVEHRLEMKKYYDINIIDDAYNSNPIGANMALEVLSLMPGKRVIATPGMIELASKDQEVHYQFGQNIAKSVDEVILVGEKKTKDIYAGLISQKFPKEKIHIINDVLDAFKLIKELKEPKKEMFVLLENDLPDIFNEGKKSE